MTKGWRRISAAVVVALVMCAVSGWAQAVDVEVDLELVLAVDVSNSVDDGENALQRAGYVAALGHEDVWAAIAAGRLGRIAVTYVEWAGPEKQKTVLPWRLIDSAETARAVAADLAAPDILFTRGTGTSISAALVYSAIQFKDNGFDGHRRVIDISGDGPNNRGYPVDLVRDVLVDGGITINGLPLMVRPSRTFAAMDRYYNDCVVGGSGAFVLPVLDGAQLAAAIRYKMIREIAGLAPAGAARVVLAQAPTDCRVGQR